MSGETLSNNLDSDEKDPALLSDIFDNAFELFNEINATQEPTNSSKIQVCIINLEIMYFFSNISTHCDSQSFN